MPTLVDPKKRVRQASQECVAILAAFMGPTKAAPLIRSIELLESHFERGAGVLNAVQARLSRRQLPRITADGLVEYSLQIPRSALRYNTSSRGRSGSPLRNKKYGADIEWILAGKTCDGVTDFRGCRYFISWTLEIEVVNEAAYLLNLFQYRNCGYEGKCARRFFYLYSLIKVTASK